MGFNEIVLNGKYVIDAEIKLLTGLHIGTAGNSLDIGGVDNPVIKDVYGKPYIPGSSLKGKLRSLMEFYNNKLTLGNVIYSVKSEKNPIRMHMCDKKDCIVCGLFGRNHGKHDVIQENNKIESIAFDEAVEPTRLIVRDAHLIDESITDEMKDNMDFEYTEVKFENNIDRITSAANPRQTERVPAGATFKCNFVVNVYNDDDKKYFEALLTAMKLLEDDYLGGQGSRGYGQVKFENIKIEYKGKNAYLGKEDKKVFGPFNSLNEVKLG
ncbi:MAG: csm3 [Caloramator sp.]|jgi:CRISPR-associated protein Csm3|uniref:type III-A CRISPR-associated RAMP protein Csm3 n=1 Tax=Caloramator sp. TaxID=1871330 RepID=UPI001D95B9D2|nr:type III-A CRISPR-associated RAMP protein Csm3 [Caloramator sp.]MBZ4663998.1 csm3 [Caloramator sp.]